MSVREAVASALGFPFSLRQRARRVRPPMSRAQFIEVIVDADGDESAAGMVWDLLVADWVCIAGFTPYPDDDLEHLYGVADEELDEDLIRHVLNALGVAVPAREFIDAFGVVDTPLRLAQFVMACRHLPSDT